jgi:tetratricopeptide (TPR) repeat protein
MIVFVHSSNDPDQVLGKAKVYERCGNFKKGIELLDQSLSTFASFLPIYLERMKFEVATKDWDRLLETCSKALSLERHCIEANRHLILYYLVWDYNEQQVYAKFSDLINSLELREPKNAHLYHETSRIFSSIVSHPSMIIMLVGLLVRLHRINQSIDRFG